MKTRKERLETPILPKANCKLCGMSNMLLTTMQTYCGRCGYLVYEENNKK